MNPNPLNFDTFLYVFKRWLFIVFLAFSIIVAFLLPDTIPTHFNENGEVDAYGNKSYFLILPIIIQTFVRGAGYFNGGFLLFVFYAFVLWINSYLKKNQFK